MKESKEALHFLIEFLAKKIKKQSEMNKKLWNENDDLHVKLKLKMDEVQHLKNELFELSKYYQELKFKNNGKEKA